MKFSGVMAVLGVRARNAEMRVALVVAISVFASACGKPMVEEKFEKIECGPTDQYRSYMNPMDSTQIQTISIDGTFSADQITKIEKAVQTWNTYGRRTLGRDLFRTDVASVSANSVPSPTDDCGFPGVSNAFSIVRVNDSTTWSALGFTKNNPGVTLRCSTGRAFASKQVVLINPANMPDATLFETVILHELGHAIGLDHSCLAGSTGEPNYAGCRGLNSEHDYVQALMYPYVDVGHLKEELRSNDEERAACALNYRP